MSSDFLEEFAQMALELNEKGSVDDTVDRVLEYALKAVNCGYAGVMIVHGRKRIETAAATSPLVAEIESLQTECGQGPDLDVLEDRYSVLVRDTRTETRWPTCARCVADKGIRSLLSVRLYTSSSTVGTLNLYDEQPDAFDAVDQDVAHVLARHAAVALSHARQTENLWQAIDARKRVGQAQGILMERYQLSEDQAFAVLMRYSQNNNMKLREVAERLISTRDLPTGPGPAPSAPPAD
ncbi:MAG: GAF and ANTAR domain-containing protein [Marmoricola sp.]